MSAAIAFAVSATADPQPWLMLFGRRLRGIVRIDATRAIRPMLDQLPVRIAEIEYDDLAFILLRLGKNEIGP